MEKKGRDSKGPERRSELRSIDKRFSSVEFSINKLNFLYQFRIWDTSQSGMSILIKEDSEVLEHLHVGDVLDMKYYPEELYEKPVSLKTEIIHITRDVPDRIKGHYLIGLSACEEECEDP